MSDSTCAVYDKKLLWRANLYIDEGTGDWNDVHPWNAPPTGVSINDFPAWGKNGTTWVWGNNDWNRIYNGETYFAAMSDLTAGNGRQVARPIPDSIWLYQMKDDNPEFLLEGRVSYDHQGWDDPFSFTKKMLSQKKFLGQYYAFDGRKFKKPIYQWSQGVYTGDPESWTITDAQKKTRIKECLPSSYDSNNDLQQLSDAFKNFRDNSMSRWMFVLPPPVDPEYKYYVHPTDYGTNGSPYGVSGNNPDPSWVDGVTKAVSNEMTLTLDEKVYYPYVPGLSDSIMGTISYPPAAIGRRTAGVDCNGLVQRAHAYIGENYGAINNETHSREPVYWIGGDIPSSAMGNFTYHTDWQTQVVSRDGGEEIDDPNSNDPLKTIMLYDQFQFLVPGDVIVYKDPEGIVTHIMIVSEIKAPSGPEGRYVAADLVILESVYHQTDAVFGAVKTRHMGKLSDRDWSIWRQK